MTRYGVSVEKSVSFRGATQIFANVYYYESPIPTTGNTDLTSLLDAIVAQEKTLHATSVTFVRGRVWSAGGGPSANQMIVDKPLSGAGVATADTTVPREMAFLVRYRAGSDSRGRPVYLRKWWHLLCTSVGGNSVSSAMIANTTALSAGIKTSLVTFADFFKTITINTQACNLVSKTGRSISGATAAHDWYEHHQLGDMWRGV